MKEKVLIVGLGEVGRTLFELFKESGKFDVFGLDSDTKKMRSVAGKQRLPKEIDTMHICYPCLDEERFVQITVGYIAKMRPGLVIVESTVPPGTTQKIYNLTKSRMVHSPIRGMHKTLETMKRDIRFWRKYVGGVTRESADFARNHFEKMGLKVRVLDGPAETELAKLFETIYRAWMIACFQEMHRISRHFKTNLDQTVDFLEDTHRLRLDRPLHYPDVISGHCLIPNTKLLLKSHDSKFLRLILESNEKRKKEIKNKEVREEVQKIKERTEKLQEGLARRRL